MTSAVEKGLDEDYVEIERRLKLAQVRLYAAIVPEERILILKLNVTQLIITPSDYFNVSP